MKVRAKRDVVKVLGKVTLEITSKQVWNAKKNPYIPDNFILKRSNVSYLVSKDEFEKEFEKA